MLELCLAPVLLAGFVSTMELHTNVSKDSAGQGAIIQALSCTRGLGVGAKVTSLGVHAIEAHYGFSHDAGPWHASILPKFGLSFTDKPMVELPQVVQFSLGVQTLLGYEQAYLGFEYWHMSNGDALGLSLTNKQNIGLDTFSLTLGYTF